MSYAAGLAALLFAQVVVSSLLPCGLYGEVVSPVQPLQTELIVPLDLSHVHVGSPVLVRAARDWTGSNCTLRTGSMVQGHVVELVKRSHTVRDSQVQLAFDAADCEAHHEASFRLTLVALIGPVSSTGQSGVSEASPLADAVGNAIGSGLRSVGTASAINAGFNFPNQNLPSHIAPGQVIGMRKMTLGVAAGLDGATVVTAVGHDLRLEQGTSLILTHAAANDPTGGKTTLPANRVANAPERQGFNVSGTVGGGSELVGSVHANNGDTVPPVKTARRAADVVDETEICSGACNVVDDLQARSELRESSTVASLELKRYGYAPREHRELRSFDHETTLTYLDAGHLLCTFDPHRLRERAGSGEEAVRNVRAVMVDPMTHSVQRVVEWRVRGEEQYLWQLGGGRVLVHMGRELRLFDVHLRALRSINVAGKVAWVVSSPSGDHVAVGTVHERHSEPVHRDLEAVLSEAPEEDVEVRVLDENFAVVLTAQQSSRTPAPVLSDAGELLIHGDGHTHWKITEYHWNRTEQTIASTRSACRPLLSTPESGLIFAVGCTTSGGHWYRMLRMDGHPLLKGESASDEIQQAAQAAGEGTFAVRIVKTVRAMSYGQAFSRPDLAQETITVYRSADGTSVAAVTTVDFTLSQMAFALSPAGDQIALMGINSVLFYRVNLRRN